MQIGGGLGDEYMHAPALQVGGGGGGKGGGGFFANLLDLLGLNRQVAKGPKDKGGKDGIPHEKGPAKGNDSSGAQIVSPTGGAPAFTPMMGASTTLPSSAPPPAISVLDDADAAFSSLRPRVGKLGILPNSLR